MKQEISLVQGEFAILSSRIDREISEIRTQILVLEERNRGNAETTEAIIKGLKDQIDTLISRQTQIMKASGLSD